MQTGVEADKGGVAPVLTCDVLIMSTRWLMLNMSLIALSHHLRLTCLCTRPIITDAGAEVSRQAAAR